MIRLILLLRSLNIGVAVTLIKLHVHHIFAIVRSYLFLRFLRFVYVLFLLRVARACISHLTAQALRIYALVTIDSRSLSSVRRRDALVHCIFHCILLRPLHQ